jgi:hypothetical protein
MIKFLNNLDLLRVKNANFLVEKFGKNFKKITTSVPSWERDCGIYIPT